MGQGYIIECPKCQYRSKDIMMGVGFLFGSVENILDTLTGHDQEQVQRLLNQKQVPAIRLGLKDEISLTIVEGKMNLVIEGVALLTLVQGVASRVMRVDLLLV